MGHRGADMMYRGEPVTAAEYMSVRRRWLRGGQPDQVLWAELRRVVAIMVRSRALPPAYSPYGEWSREAEEDVFQRWAQDRLVAEGQLRALVAKCATLSAFRSMAEISLRQHLLNSRQRTQTQNLYARLRELLKTDPVFRCFIEAADPKDCWWGLTEWRDPAPFNGDERALLSAAWSVGTLTLVRYRSDARKLSPVLDAGELRRFASGTLGALRTLLTAGLLIRALQLRMDLDPPASRSVDEGPEPVNEELGADDRLALRETAIQAIGELTRRQVDVLIGTDSGETLTALAHRLGCSRVTVFNEQERAGAIISRLSTDSVERNRLLNTVLEILYEVVSR